MDIISQYVSRRYVQELWKGLPQNFSVKIIEKMKFDFIELEKKARLSYTQKELDDHYYQYCSDRELEKSLERTYKVTTSSLQIITYQGDGTDGAIGKATKIEVIKSLIDMLQVALIEFEDGDEEFFDMTIEQV